MIVKFSTSGLKQAKWYEFPIRFALGVLVTTGAGPVAKKFGPSFGGLFLAFPAHPGCQHNSGRAPRTTTQTAEGPRWPLSRAPRRGRPIALAPPWVAWG